MRKPLLSSSFDYKQQDPDYKGEPLELDYTDDPVQNRTCKDLLCCILFVLYLGFMGYIAFRAYETGNPVLLASPFDSCKNQCGVKQGFEEYKKVFISNLKTNITQVSFVCVKNCPNLLNTTLQCQINRRILDCDQLNLYQTQTFVNVCIPQPGAFIDFDFEKFRLPILQQYFSDLRDAQYLVLAIVGVSLVISIIYTMLMRWFAGCFLWCFIVVFISFLTILGTVLLVLPLGEMEFLRKWLNYDELPRHLKDREYQIGCGIFSVGLAAVTLIIVFCSKRQIRISIGIIKAASDFVRSCCSALLIPLYISAFQAISITFWAITMVFIFSSNDSTRQPIQNTPFSMISWNEDIQILTIVYLLGIIWIVLFFEGLGSYWTSSVVAIWYFQSGEPTSPIIRSIYRSIKSFGSIAFGSLLLTLVAVIKIVLEYINIKTKKSTLAIHDSHITVIKFILKCAACLVACFERIIRFLTQNAYIMMAITGNNFCASARQSFYLIVRCAGQFALSRNSTKLFIVLGKIFIVAWCCVIGYLFITNIEPYKEQIYEPIFLTLIFALASYPITAAFMTLFEMAANTLLVCYCIQIDLAKGRSRCPQGLKAFIQEYLQSSSLFDQIQNQN